MIKTIVIRPNLGVDLAKEQGPGLYGSTQVNPNQPGKKNIWSFNITYEENKKQSIWIYAIHVINNEV
jgi:hypothetical protein